MLKPATPLMMALGVGFSEVGLRRFDGVRMATGLSSSLGVEGSSESIVVTCRSGLGRLGAVPWGFLVALELFLRLRLGVAGAFLGLLGVCGIVFDD